ncbi:alpha/beta fold hydrolase [Nakamurella sp.]|uniref:alpha/beta fold hydrolase n=1 Tax=Nakamurella sp. TaxID=1869182 RepID=UPI003783BF72
MRGTVTSADGTEIVFDRVGQGPAVIVVGGALMNRSSPRETVQLLAERYTVHSYDRRGRGESGDVLPYSPEREIDDLVALLDEAGPSRVFGMSSGGFLALGIAAHDSRVVKAAVYEPPYLTGDGPLAAADYRARLDEAVATGHPDRAVELFLRQVSGGRFDDSIRSAPWWPGMVAMGPSLRYDAALTGDGSVPVDTLSRISAPVLAMYGGASDEWAERSVRAVAAAVPEGAARRFDGQNHQVDQGVLARALAEFFDD